MSNLITVVPSGDSHASTETAHNSRLTMAYSVNAQSVREIAGEIHDFIVDNKLDALILTQTWLQEVGDEPCIKEMTLPDYVFHFFPRVGRRGGGIAVLMSQSLAPKVTFRCLSYASFEAVMMCLFAKKLVHLTVFYLVNKISSRQKCFTTKMHFLRHVVIMCLEISNNLLLVLWDAPKRLFSSNSRSSDQPKNDAKTLFVHPPSPFHGNFCNRNSIGICTASQF